MNMISLLLATLLTMSMATIISHTPMSMALSILSISLITAYMFSHILSSWIAFLIFIIYISGMLVMFAYFVATNPNISINTKTFNMLIPSWTLLIVVISYNNISWPLKYWPNINTMYSSNTMPMLIILATVLLLAMIIVVKLASSQKGPLRPYMYV